MRSITNILRDAKHFADEKSNNRGRYQDLIDNHPRVHGVPDIAMSYEFSSLMYYAINFTRALFSNSNR